MNSHPAWVHGTAYPHPEFTNETFVLHDAGVVVLDVPVSLPQYGALPALGFLDQFLTSRRNEQRFTDVGYGLTHVLPFADEGGDSREQSTTMLVSLHGQGLPYGTDVMFTNNNGKTHQGGTCFGDSGGPVLVQGTNQIVAVTSWGWSPNCTGFDAAYRIDQQDDLDFTGQFLAP